MNIKTEPNEIAKEYEDDKSFKSGLDLYETVKRNNNFYQPFNILPVYSRIFKK